MNKILQIIIFTLLSSTAFGQKTILMMVPDDFMWPEYSEPRTAYEKAGFKVVVAGKWKDDLKPDLRNKKDYPSSKAVKPDLTFDEVVYNQYDAVSFVAGNGAWHDFFPNPKVHEILNSFLNDESKITGLICASTGLLGISGNFSGSMKPIAEGRKVVGYYKVEGLLRNMGQVKFVSGKVDEVTVVKDGNLITARNPQSSQKFGEAIVQALVTK